MNNIVFINKLPRFLEIIVFKYESRRVFQKNENRFVSLVLKAKQRKAIQLPKSFLKFSMNQFLLFLHFPDLWSLVSYVESMLFFTPCYFLLNMKVIWNFDLNSFERKDELLAMPFVWQWSFVCDWSSVHFRTRYKVQVFRRFVIFAYPTSV